MTALSPADWLAAAAVDADVFELRPDYVVVLMTADGLTPGPSDDASNALLSAAEQQVATRLAQSAPEELPHVAQWREAYRSFGAKPQRTRPSVEALLRRVGEGLPRIDRITDTYNAISIMHLIPLGGEDRTAYVGPPRLVRASGEETFDVVAGGVPAVESPRPGEVVWRDDVGVTCRRWNWRQCVRTQITEHTASAVFILDGLSDLGVAGAEAAADALMRALQRSSPGAVIGARTITASRSNDL